MLSASRFLLISAAGLALASGWAQLGHSALGDAEPGQVAAADPHLPPVATADVELRFIQEGGPGSGQVRVILTPQNRQLTLFEARSAAQQAFLHALSEPGLGGPLNRVTVVVQLLPAGAHAGSEKVIQFRYKGGRDWAVTLGE